MAAAGFYQAHKGGAPDEVTCAECRQDINCWEEGDIPVEKHSRIEPDCLFLRARQEQTEKISTSASIPERPTPIRAILCHPTSPLEDQYAAGGSPTLTDPSSRLVYGSSDSSPSIKAQTPIIARRSPKVIVPLKVCSTSINHPLKGSRGVEKTTPSSAASDASPSLKSLQRHQPAARKKHKNTFTSLKPCREEVKTDRVLPSVELSAKKRILESGIEYPSRKRFIGAGKTVQTSSENTTVTIQNSRRRQSKSITPRGLNADMGKERDDDWLPSLRDIVDTRPFPRLLTSTSPYQRLTTSPVNEPDRTASSSFIPSTLSSQNDYATDPVKPEFPAATLNLTHDNAHHTPRSPSQSIWSFDLRRERLDQDGFVEMPKAVVEYYRTKKELLALNEQLKAQKETLEEEMKANKPEQVSKREDEEVIMEPHKTKKKSGNQHKRENQDAAFVAEGTCQINLELPLNDRKAATVDVAKPETSGQGSSVEPQGSSQKGDRSVEAYVGTQYHTSTRRNTNINRTSSEGSQKRQKDDGMRGRYQRREINHARSRKKQCKCEELPQYFVPYTNFIPSLATWDGCKEEFLAHASQILSCGGHSNCVKDACYHILKREGYLEHKKDVGQESVVDYARWSPPSWDNGSRQRAQSSIPPRVFYADATPAPNKAIRRARSISIRREQPVVQSDTNQPSSVAVPRSVADVRCETESGTIQANKVVTRPKALHIMNATDSHPTPPESSPLATSPGPDTCNDPLVQKNEAETENFPPRIAPDVSVGTPLGPTPISLRRKRHQSMPAPSIAIREDAAEEAVPFLGDPLHGQAPLQPIPANAPLPVAVEKLTLRVSSLENVLEVSSTNLVEIVAIGANARPEQQQRKMRKATMTAAERRRKNPQLERNVPEHVRLPEDMIVHIGKTSKGY